ncbi:hypothetical protein [Streptomyces sp. NPDC056682]|uniref:hypothetical protein n=1 Tax=Streptomyces sp. NPDC056682 TaxID=3345909 RepID=UPI0036D01B7A
MSKTPEFMAAMDTAELENLRGRLDRDVNELQAEGHCGDYVLPDSPGLTLRDLMVMRYLAECELAARDVRRGEMPIDAAARLRKKKWKCNK